MNIHNTLSGEYRMVLTQPDGSTKDTGWFKNLVTDNGLNLIGQRCAGTLSTRVDAFLHIGTGTTAPATTDTALAAYVASRTRSSGTTVNEGAPNYRCIETSQYDFVQGAVVGNMAEVGVGPVTGNTNIFSRARIVDGANNPTTITVTAIDQLTVYYRLYTQQVLTDSPGTLVLSGSNYPFTMRAASAAGFTSSFLSTSTTTGVYNLNLNWYGAGYGLGAITATPTGGSSNTTATVTIPTPTYTAGSFYCDHTLTLPPAGGNVTGGISAMAFLTFSGSGGAKWQVAFSTPIPKDNTKTLVFGVRVSWSR